MTTNRKNSATGKKPDGNSAPSMRVRMYRVGFGDCFLLTLGRTHEILIDCGVHSQGNIKVNGDHLIDKAFADIAKVTGRKLDIVIATHAHQDHVSGFGKFADEFRKFTVGEVWLPWTDNLADPVARKWHEKKKSLVGLLRTQLAASGNRAAADAAENAEANPEAMQALREGFGSGKLRYLKAGDEVTSPAGIAGLSAKILGPPQDQKLISKMNPPSSDHYLRMVASVLAGAPVRPFASWELKAAQLLAEWPHLDAKQLSDLADQAKFPAAAVAFALDKLLNNTSIVALFSWKGKRLLFPGDAEYGDWSWYKDAGADLLSDISFYKVAHHGSWNATPKGAVEEMPEGRFVAMMSTQNKPWKSIPRKGLVDALKKQTNGNLARADSLAVNGAPNCPEDVPETFKMGKVDEGEYWIDYVVK